MEEYVAKVLEGYNAVAAAMQGWREACEVMFVAGQCAVYSGDEGDEEDNFVNEKLNECRIFTAKYTGAAAVLKDLHPHPLMFVGLDTGIEGHTCNLCQDRLQMGYRYVVFTSLMFPLHCVHLPPCRCNDCDFDLCIKCFGDE